MSRTFVSILHVPTPATPRGAQAVEILYTWIAAAFRSASSPPVLTRAEEAAPVRALAYSVQDKQPGFAADLFAAAARHESKDDELPQR